MSNPIVGESGVEGGSGVVTTKTQRVVLATDVTPPTHPVTANAGTNLNTSALALEAGGNLAGATTSLAVIDDWDESDRAKVNLIAGQAGVQGASGVVTALTQRVVLATDVAITVPAPLSTTGGGTEATAHRVTIANDSTGVVSVDDNGASLTVDGSVTANAGTNLNTSALALEAGGNLAGAAASLSVMDDWDETDRAKVNLIVGQAGIAAGTGVDGVTVPRVTLATNVGLPAGAALLGRIASSDETSTIYNGTTALTPKYGVIDVAASGDNTLLAAVSSKKIRVIALWMISAGTVTARFESGASGTALSGQMNLVANTGFVLPYNPAGWFETAVTTLLNLELSAAISCDGAFTYLEV